MLYMQVDKMRPTIVVLARIMLGYMVLIGMLVHLYMV